MKRPHSIFIFGNARSALLLFLAGLAPVRMPAQATTPPGRQKLLLRATVKPGEILRQPEFSPRPLVEGDAWKPRGQFAYSRDRALKDLELSGADLRFRNLVQV